MREIRAFPYLIPIDAVSIIEDWHFNDSHQPLDISESLIDWDPAQSIDVAIVLQADLGSSIKHCGLSKDASLRLVTGWKSTGTMLKGNGQSAELIASNSGCPIKLRLQVDGTNISHDVSLFVGLILVSSGSTRNPLAPRLPGSVLWSMEQRLLLNNFAHRFPTELADFSARDWPIPQHAAWYLQWDHTDLEQSVLGDVCLYLNSIHPLVIQAVYGDHSNAELVHSFIFFDLARTLILGALSNTDFVADAAQYPDGTVGAVIRELLKRYFPERSIHSLKTMSENLAYFEAQLQHHLNFLES